MLIKHLVITQSMSNVVIRLFVLISKIKYDLQGHVRNQVTMLEQMKVGVKNYNKSNILLLYNHD